jgi:two-component system, OmpR family, response regulator
MRLLLIEDDDLLGDGLSTFLRGEGHRVDWCRTLAEARVLQSQPFDAWLIDWQLPDGSGRDWLAAQRAHGASTHAYILTARQGLDSRVSGLDAGADDYLVKPVAPEELSARLRSLARRLQGSLGAAAEHAGVHIDLTARQVRLHGERVLLTGREWGVLEALTLRPGRIVSKPELERLVFGAEADLNSNAVEVHVAALRRKLGRDIVLTERGLGYRLGPAS